MIENNTAEDRTLKCPNCNYEVPPTASVCGNCGRRLMGGAPPLDIITFRRSHFFLALLPIAFVLGLAAGYVFWGLPRPATTAVAAAPAAREAPAPAQADAPAGPPQRVEVSLDDDPALGPADAPITIVEFSDFECPFCQRFHAQTLAALLAAYPDQIRFVYRDFPLVQIHAQAAPAAEAAQCAFDQDRFWQFHDGLFNRTGELGADLYRQVAEQNGLDVTAFEECVSSGRNADEVTSDLNDGINLGVTGTPTFFVNGVRLVGAQPLSAFQQIIDQELSRASEN